MNKDFTGAAYLLVMFFCIGSNHLVLAQDNVQTLWSGSAHANSTSNAFTHWDDEGIVPQNCAACHSSSGFSDYIGLDGSTVLTVEKEHPTGTVVECDVCHNDTIKAIGALPFSSGISIEPPTDKIASCMVCHQGRASTVTVNEKLGDTQPDSVNPDLGFVNIHYKAAAATMFGTDVKGGYEYDGKTYQGAFEHVPEYDTCVGCHNPHSLEVNIASCAGCHHNTASADDIRMATTDYDGDDDTTEGIAKEIDTLHSSLGAAITAYADQIVKAPILYSPDHYPYYFHDENKNTIAEDTELSYPNRYAQWSPRLLRAAYNYQYVAKDTGAYAHNPIYALQILYDSLKDLSVSINIDLSQATRP